MVWLMAQVKMLTFLDGQWCYDTIFHLYQPPLGTDNNNNDRLTAFDPGQPG